MAIHNEVEFEKELCEYLQAHGWLYSTDDDGYDAARALFPEDVFGWLTDTQPDELAKVVKPGAPPAVQQASRNQLLERIAKQLDTDLSAGGGTLNVLRGVPVKHISARFRMCQFKPNTKLNEKTLADYAKVRVRVMRQVHYSTKNNNSLDLVLFVNGLPVATLELKTDNTQTVKDAIAQYRKDRKPEGEPLLGFGTRALVHFAVSNTEVHMTTKLAGDKTFFLPFNMGRDGAAGNPANPDGSATSYLWERVLQRDAWLHIIGRLMHLSTEIDVDPITGAKTKKTTLLFPRFHQWDVVTKLLSAAKREGPGHKYLIEHSAGSGKTNSIAWTSHGLATLHDAADKKVFDTVIVVTDRTVLDDQLKEAVKQIEPAEGMVVTVGGGQGDEKAKSVQLAKALSDGRHIVVVTLQTFPFALDAIAKTKGLAGRAFAVIADEAHSSQTGDAASKLKKVLTTEDDGGGEIDVEAVLNAEIENRAEATNVSYFAFTATPKAKTLELFGRPDANGKPQPFHRYTMQQAIEEGFILDVLQNYTPYKAAYKIATTAGGKEVDASEATKSLIRWAKLHPSSIAQKVGIIIEHFRENVAHLIDGHAKAMVVCDSRKAAVRYKIAFDKYIADKGYTDLAALVAFSGDDVPMEPEDGPGPFNERTLNAGLKGRSVRDAFASGDEYRVMLVANKFQTGFDQPLLCAMYVDKRLSGVTAVQTLSRLNRTYSKGGKNTTYVLDFVNEPDDILDDFKTYFAGASLVDTSDPNLIHDLQNKLDMADIYTTADVIAVSDAVVKNLGHGKFDAAISIPARRFLDRWQTATINGDKAERDVLEVFRKDVGSFVRLYDFLSQMVNYGDTDLERRSILLRRLAQRIKTDGSADPFDTSPVSIEKLKYVKGQQANLKLGVGDPLKPISSIGTGRAKTDPKMLALEKVIELLNTRFGGEAFEEHQQQSWVEAAMRGLLSDSDLVTQANANNVKQFMESEDFKAALQVTIMENQAAFEKMTEITSNDVSFQDQFQAAMAEAFHVWATTPDAEPEAENADEGGPEH